jgi:hypothetical protein
MLTMLPLPVDDRLVEIAPIFLVGRDVADVVDQHVDAAGLLPRRRDHRADLVPRLDVRLHDDRLAAEFAHRRGSRLRPGFRGVVVHDDVRAFGGRAFGERRAEAGSGAGHHDPLAFEARECARDHTSVRPPST